MWESPQDFQSCHVGKPWRLSPSKWSQIEDLWMTIDVWWLCSWLEMTFNKKGGMMQICNLIFYVGNGENTSFSGGSLAGILSYVDPFPMFISFILNGVAFWWHLSCLLWVVFPRLLLILFALSLIGKQLMWWVSLIAREFFDLNEEWCFVVGLLVLQGFFL